MNRGVREILQDATDALALTTRAVDEFLNAQGLQRLVGIRNVAIWGRIVTATLWNLKSVVGDASFAEWWARWRAELKDDAGFKYLWDLRNQIEKEGRVGELSHSTRLSFNTEELKPFMANPPPHAKEFHIGGEWGGNGWIVEYADGQTEMFYVQLPNTLVDTTLHFIEPTSSQKVPPPDEALESLFTRYLDLLRRVVADASARFK